MALHADLLITNARVFTSDLTNPRDDVNAVAVKGNRIVFAGSAADAQGWRGPGTRLIDAGQQTLIPGFVDSHFHLLHGSLKLDGIQLEGAADYDTMAQRIHAFAGEHPNRPWLDGYGLRYNLGPGHQPLTRHDLDAIIADQPVVVTAYDYHTAWANTLGLKLAGIFNGGECGPNSEIVLDEHGEATGELREGAQGPVRNLLPEPDAAHKRALLHKGLRQAAELGVTSVHNMNCDWEEAVLYAALEDAGELTARVYVPYDIKPHTPFEALADDAVNFRQTYQSEMVRAGSVKFFMDGVIESYTGLLVESYADDPGTRGDANFTPEHFNRMAVEADRLGFQIKVHATGDLAVRRVLDGYEAAQRLNGKRDSRHRVEHIELIHPDDIGRFKQLEVIASMQPLHNPLSPQAGDVWPSRVGPQRWGLSFAWQTLREAGALLAFGSDWPVVSQNPMLGVNAAVNRQLWQAGLPDQRQTLADTLVAYTRDAAYAEFQEGQKGQLKAGYLADMVLLSEDIFSIPSEQLASARPVLTMCDGKIVFGQ
jgi:predicted amidohydrolase YtcJ